MCSGCGLSVMLENSMLSICVTVRVVAVLGERADHEILEIEAAALVPHAPCPASSSPPRSRPCTRQAFVYHNLLTFPFSHSRRTVAAIAARRERRESCHAGRRPPEHQRSDRDRRDPPGGAADRRRASSICSPPPRSSRTSIRRPGASTSSARGLFQFIEQTWLATLKEQGAGARLRPLCRRHHPDRRPGDYAVHRSGDARRRS